MCILVESGAMIFVVDDDLSVRKALKRLLSSAGFKVETFGSAEELLTSGRQELPDVFVIDVRMPGLSGLDLQKALTASGSRIPVIFITAYRDDQARTLAKEAGAVAFLQKPFDDRALLEAVETGLTRKAFEPRNVDHSGQ
jgi:FixJ family two-component response regulator